jgi:hypothetical protein
MHKVSWPKDTAIQGKTRHFQRLRFFGESPWGARGRGFKSRRPDLTLFWFESWAAVCRRQNWPMSAYILALRRFDFPSFPEEFAIPQSRCALALNASALQPQH